MNPAIPIYLAVEDELSEWVARRLLKERTRSYAIGAVFGKTGAGYLKKRASSFNSAARHCPFLLLADLDDRPCAPVLLAEWLDRPRHDSFLLRVAVREVESWLMGDGDGLAAYLGCRRELLPMYPETVQDPKRVLLQLATASRSRRLREAVVWRDPVSGELRQGPDYNGALGQFVQGSWNTDVATARCPSLKRVWSALLRFEEGYRFQPENN
jgi:hypothetical protein